MSVKRLSPSATRVERGAALAGLALVVFVSGCERSTVQEPFVSPSNVSVPTPVPANLPPPAPKATPGPNPPVLVLRLRPDPATGPAPLDVNFNLCRSFDPDGDHITYTFTFGDGKTKTLNYCRHDHVYTRPGSYTATICATDGRSTTCQPVAVTVM